MQLIENTLQKEFEKHKNKINKKLYENKTTLENQIQNEISQKIKIENENSEILNYISSIIEGTEKQNQAVLEIVKNLEDKYNKIKTFDQLQEREIKNIVDKKFESVETKNNKLIERKLKSIENKYDKLIDKKLKEIEKEFKAKMKILENKSVSKTSKSNKTNKSKVVSNNTNGTKVKNQIIYTAPIESKKQKNNTKNKKVSKTLSNTSLKEKLDKLRSTKLVYSNLEKSVNDINKILGYTDKKDAD